MKVDRGLKIIFYISFSILYLSGVLDYAFGILWGPQPAQTFALHVHGIAGLWFLVLGGHFFKAHIWPSLRGIRHRRSGLLLWSCLGILCLSVPFLYYLGDERWRNATVALHTYLGIAVALPLLLHIALAIRERPRSGTYRRTQTPK